MHLGLWIVPFRYKAASSTGMFCSCTTVFTAYHARTYSDISSMAPTTGCSSCSGSSSSSSDCSIRTAATQALRQLHTRVKKKNKRKSRTMTTCVIAGRVLLLLLFFFPGVLVLVHIVLFYALQCNPSARPLVVVVVALFVSAMSDSSAIWEISDRQKKSKGWHWHKVSIEEVTTLLCPTDRGDNEKNNVFPCVTPMVWTWRIVTPPWYMRIEIVTPWKSDFPL